MIIAGMSKEDLVLLAFSREETETKLSWHHSREFEYEGEMFDIVDTAFRGDSVFYWCWHDTEETNIGKQIDDLAARTLGGDPQKKEQQQRFVNLMKIQFLACGYSPGLTPDPGGHFTFPEHPTDYVSVSFQPLTPPPKFS